MMIADAKETYVVQGIEIFERRSDKFAASKTKKW